MPTSQNCAHDLRGSPSSPPSTTLGSLLPLVLWLLAACSAPAPELAPGVYLRSGNFLPELPRQIGPPAAPDQAVTDTRPVLVVHLPDEDIAYLQLRGVWETGQVPPEPPPTLSAPPAEPVLPTPPPRPAAGASDTALAEYQRQLAAWQAAVAGLQAEYDRQAAAYQAAASQHATQAAAYDAARAEYLPVVSGLIPLELVSKKDGVHEIRPAKSLLPGDYCLMLGATYLMPEEVSHWCFKVGET